MKLVLILVCVLLLENGDCKGSRGGGGGGAAAKSGSASSGSKSGSGSATKSSYSALNNGGKTSSSPAPSPPAARPCQALSASVSTNILRDMPCAEAVHCFVVVNKQANSEILCLQWSPNAYYDGLNCVCRCELLGGALNVSAAVPEKTCVLQDRVLEIYNMSRPDVEMFLAPIKCGTWLGARDSAWNQSWFNSDCFSIMDNRYGNNPVSVRNCDVDRYTSGCRFLDTNQRWVPECRHGNLTECGVKVPCPAQNPCGLGSDIDYNLDNMFSSCAAQTHLALNVSADEDNCLLWHEFAFLLDGFCVSSCGRIDNQCVLNGVSIPPCNTVRSFQDGSILSISPEVCSVPMPSDVFAGFRNGFYGMSRVQNSECSVMPNCTSWFMCFRIEGLSITPLSAEKSKDLPVCNGGPSLECKIEYPCFVPDAVTPFECKSGFLLISQSIYSQFGVYSCSWFTCRDIITTILWIFSFPCVCYFGKGSNFIDTYFILVILVCIGVSCVWEILVLFVWMYAPVYLIYAYKPSVKYTAIDTRAKVVSNGSVGPLPLSRPAEAMFPRIL